MTDDLIKDDSPFPDQSDMDLDMLRVSRPMPDGTRMIKGADDVTVARIPYHGDDPAERDAMARRIEMMGEVYEALRVAAEKMAAAGMDVSTEHRILTEFVSPKPFAEGQ